MPKNPEPQPGPDAENPEWTAAKFAQAKRIHHLPEALQQALGRRTRGPQKTPTKTLISLRLSSDVLEALRAKGKGWQTMVDDALRRHFVK